MARAPDQRVEQARKLYAKGLKLIEIAGTLGVPEGTVRSWKNRYDWDNATLQKNKCKSLLNPEVSLFRRYLFCQCFPKKTRMNTDVLRVFDLSVTHFIF